MISSKNVTKKRQNNWYRSLSLSQVCFSWLYFKSLRFSGGIFIFSNFALMQKIIFTEEYCKPKNLHPFTLTRHIQDIRVGILTIREKWERLLKLTSLDKWENYYLDDERSIKIDKNIGEDICLMVHANVLPTKFIISKIKKLQHRYIYYI